jgi:asparagine synthase (glutamine-hydrolysing)
MCGICGILNIKNPEPVERALVERMSRVMEYRGPDDSGLYLDADCGLASRRLAILDLSLQGHMPMASADGRYWIVYNGEVYNFAELRAELQVKGVQFHSHTDTEVLINLYIMYGPEMLPRCNGMFALAIWDTVERHLFVARDRMGVKPLFYALQNGRFFFGSEEKVLFAAGVRAEFDESTWPELLCFRYVSGERTPFRAVRRLLPGHYLIVHDGEVKTHQWWSLTDAAGNMPLVLTSEQAAESLLELLDRSMRLRRISDVPVGVLLSGGIDSGGMAALTAEQAGQGVESFTVCFDQREYDESSLARQVAQRWGLKHHELFVTPEQIPALLQEATHLLDEPIVHGNDLHILAISRFAKPLVTVLLSGEGADETLGGYVRYRMFLFETLFNPLGPVARALHSVLPASGRQRKTLELLSLRTPQERLVFSSAEVFPAMLGLSSDLETALAYRWKLARQAQRIYPQGARQAMFYEQHTYLQSVLDRNDRMTMGASIECREPYLDYELVEWSARLPQNHLFENGVGKAVLRRALRSRLPVDILQHKKWGFGVPWQLYFRQIPALRAWVENLPTQAVFESMPGGRAQMQVCVQRFLAGDDALTPLVRQWVMISLWHTQKILGQFEPLASLTPSQRFSGIEKRSNEMEPDHGRS